MRKNRNPYWIVFVLILLVGGADWYAGERRGVKPTEHRESAEKARETRGAIRSLDEMIDRVDRVTTPQGNTIEYTHLKEPVPYEEFVQAMAAEMGYTPQMPIAPTTATELQCIPEDNDYDGDGFVLSEETAGTLKGEYVADIPRVVTEFENIWPGLQITLNENGERTDRGTNVTSTGLTVTTTTSQLLDFKNHFNSRTEVNLNFGLAGLKPSFSFDVGNTSIFDVTRDQNYMWKRDVIRSLARETTRTITDGQTTEYTIASDAGFVKGDVYVANRSDYNVGIDVANVNVLVVAFHPFTGHKYTFGFGSVKTSEDQDADTLSGHLDWGQFVETSRMLGFGEMRGIDRAEIEPYLLGGWMFDMEIAGNFDATITDTGENVWAIQSRISQKTARLSIHYGSTSGLGRQFTAVSIYNEDGEHCITPRQALERIKQDDPTANLRFDWVDDRLVLVEMNGLSNRHTDRDFDSLSEAEKDEFGRWVVGFDWGPRNENFGDIDLSATPIGPEDVIYFYYLTRADLDGGGQTDSDEDVVIAFANDGTSPSEQLVSGDVSPNDVVELDLFNTFQLHSATSTFIDDGGTACGFLYNRTLYDTVVSASSSGTTVIPDVDYYGIQLQFAGLPWKDLGEVIAEAGDDYTLTMVGQPDYSIELRFKVQDSMTGLADHQPLKIRQQHARQTFNVGHRGYDLRGRVVDCRHTEARGYRRTSGDLSVYYKLDVDFDGDGSQLGDSFNAGTDPDDGNPLIFAYAPEHLDGIDNDGDGEIDNGPMLCPESLRGGQRGTCRLDDGMGWYDDPPNISSDYRWNFVDGSSTGWIPLGSATEVEVLMIADPQFAGIDVRTTHTPSTGGSFDGQTHIGRRADADLEQFPVEARVEAEDGRLLYPMSVGNLEGVDYIGVPPGTESSGIAEYQFDITTGGEHRIYLDVDADDSNSDSFIVELVDESGALVEFAGLGGSAHFQFADAGYGYNGWSTLTVGHTNFFFPSETLHPVTWNLQTGLHTLRIRQMERGSRLDALRLARWCPDADGDGWTTCEGDCDDANAGVRPYRGEVCSNSIDDDCDGVVNEGCGGGCRGCPDIHQEP